MINPVPYNNYSIYNNPGAYSYIPRVNKTVGVGSVSPIDRINRREYMTSDKIKEKECQTCRDRKYVDRSNEGNVSFKSPTHIAPEKSLALVSAHEQEHVANAISKANSSDAKLISASVRLKVGFCPECGTRYIAGGVTQTKLKYDEANPYELQRKKSEESLLKGMNIDYVA